MTRRFAWLWAASTISLGVIWACADGAVVDPPPAGYVPNDGSDAGAGSGSGGAHGSSGSGSGGSASGSGGSSGSSSGGGSGSGSGSGSGGGSGSGSGSGGGSGSGSGGGSGSSSGSSSGGGSGSSSGGPPFDYDGGVISYDPKTCTWLGGLPAAADSPPASTAVLKGDGCAGGTCLNPQCKALGTPAALGTAPMLGWDPALDLGPTMNQPSYIPNDVIIPTLDDVPDGSDPLSGTADGYNPGCWTKTILGFLDANNLHFDLFMNTNNWAGPLVGDVSKDDPDAYLSIIDILTRHNVANHTVHHIHLGYDMAPDPDTGNPQGCDGPSTKAKCVDEVTGVETVVAKMSGGGIPHLTRFRPPFGEPYQTGGPGNLADVKPIVAKYAVVIGWNMLTNDASNDPCSCVDEGAGQSCGTDSQGYDSTNGVITQFKNQVGSGPGKAGWGVMLMHGMLPWSAAALPKLFGPGGYVEKSGFRVGTVEDAICWKYGMHSWEIVNKVNNYSGADARGPN